MSVVKVQLRAMRLRKLDDLQHASFFTADAVDLRIIEDLKNMAEVLLDQESRIAKLEAGGL